jgi:uncharacterized Zn-binding protein involved in type VI secretion
MVTRAYIVIGDKTSHGGTVIEGSPTTTTHGKAVARVGDKVTCPTRGHGGITTIISCDPTCIVDGKAVARHGDKTACGATLIAGQVVTGEGAGSSEVGSAGGASGRSVSGAADVASSGATATAMGSLGASSKGPAGPSTEAENADKYDEQAKLEAPASVYLEGLPWFIRTNDGKALSGRVGADGLLPRVATLKADEYSVFLGDEALALMQGDTYE